jgi:methyltransferase family protein
VKKITKALLALNFAGILRALRYGPREAKRRLVDAYDAIDPFGKPVEAPPETIKRLAAIPSVYLSDVVPEPPIVRVDGRQKYVDGALPHLDLMALLALLADSKPDLVLEIGTFNGATTAAMALNAPWAVIHTVDLPLNFEPVQNEAGAMPKDDFHLIKQRQVGEAYASLPEIKNIVQHFADSAKWDFAPVKGASFFFIDGAHTYEYARNDTERCLSVAAPRSRFVLHDCDENHADVVRYVYELVREGKPVFRIKNTSLAFFDRKA